jgi:hypothetical protein
MSSSPSCFHGFPVEQCASCRTCSRGLTAGRCGRCLAESTVAGRRRLASSPAPEPPSEEHQGWQILYVPAVSGWQVQPPEADVMEGSYRSAFLARKAVDEWIANPPAARPSNRRS